MLQSRSLRRLSPLPLIVALLVSALLIAAPTRAHAEDPAPTPPEESTAQYSIVDIGVTLPGRSEAVGVNESGVVVGNYTVNGQKRGFVYQGGTATPLPMGGAVYVSVTGIGDNGTIGGWAADGAGGDGKWAVLWKRAKDGSYPTMTRLAPVAYLDEAYLEEGSGVLAVNAGGDALTRFTGGAVGAVYKATGGRTELQRGADPRDGIELSDLNDNGQVTGASFTEARAGQSVGVVWSPSGSYSYLPTPNGEYLTEHSVINNAGHVVAHGRQGDFVGAMSLRDGQWTPIQGFPHSDGYVKSFEPSDLNDAGLAVGQVTLQTDITGKTTRAMIWREGDEAVTDLNTLISDDADWTLGRANGVNERGQIVGMGAHYGGQSAFVLDPTAPVVFVPGAAASILADYGNDPENPEEIWLGCRSDRRRLSLDPAEPLRARNVKVIDAARSLTCIGLDGNDTKKLMAYGIFLDTLKNGHGYREYETGGDPVRRTTDGCDVDGQKDRMPNLFVFAYDWRKSNALAAEELKDYIGCVRKFYPTQDIDIVSHSMGGLVARRYVIDNPEHHVRKHISIGAPWLGAPKLVNVINTGDFITAVASGPVVKKLMAGFAAPHQLMSAQYYHQLVGPVFHEEGWDYDGDRDPNESYSWENLNSAINQRWPATTPAKTAADWHGYSTEVGGQVDWQGDDSGVDYVHIHGVQDADDTIGSVTAKRDTSCFLSLCRTRDVIETGVTRGDGTVPTPSATRIAEGFNLNAEEAEVYAVFANGDDDSVEHTALMWNPEVLEKTIDELREPDDASAARMSATSAAALDEQPTAAQRFIRLRGLTRAVVTDAAGNTNAVLPGTDVRGTVPDVATFTEGENAELVAVPVSAKPWVVDVKGTGEPARIEIREGTQEQPVEKVRFDDLSIPAGTDAQLRISSSGVETLRLDTDGDGEFETPVAPTTVQTGAAAADVTAPEAVVTAHGTGADRRYTVAATDDESGLRSIRWSTDGEHFAAYDGPIEAGTATVMHVVAEDHAGNRAYVGPVTLAEVEATPLTTATVTPKPNAQGWNTSDVTVSLDAVKAAADAAEIAAVHWSATGATTKDATKVDGDSVTIPVTATGTTVLRFRAEATDGSLEPWRSVAVRIDAAVPTATLRAPRSGSIVPTMTQLAGRAGDDASGVAKVEVSLQRTEDGRFWTGISWTDQTDWITAGGRTTWRVTDVPRHAELLNGAYSVRLRVTDNAGRVKVEQPVTFRVAPDAGIKLSVLEPMAGRIGSTSASDLNDRGVAVGAGPQSSNANVVPMRWDGARPVELDAPDWADHTVAAAIDDAGHQVGRATGFSDDRYRTEAVIWAPDGSITVLPTREEGDSAAASGVSSAGIAGVAGGRPVLWGHDGVLTTLPGRDGMTAGQALDVDSSGAAVGHLVDGQGNLHATFWEDGRARSLGDLGGPTTEVVAVNDVGQAVGHGIDGIKRRKPFIVDLYDGQAPRVLSIPGSASGMAYDVNDAGQVVGEYEVPNTLKNHAFIESDGVFTDLNQWLPAGSGWELTKAMSINDIGQVVALGIKDGVVRAVILSAEHAPTAGDVEVTTGTGTPVSVTLAGEDPDPFAEVTHEVLTQPEHGSLSALDGRSVVYTPQPGYAGTDSFTYRASDGVFKSGTGTVRITVEQGAPSNTAPVARIDAPAEAPEGTTVTLDASGSTDADGTIASWAWDLDADGEFDDADGPTAALEASDDGVRDVRVRVTDDDGATAVAAASIVVEGVAPLVDVAASLSATTGEPWSLTGTFSDAGADDVNGTVDYGTGPSQLALADDRFTLGTTYPVAGSYPVVVRLCDDDGACSSVTLTVTVSDPALTDVRATWGGYVNVPGTTRDVLGLGGTITVKGGQVQGLAAIGRAGQKTLSVGLVKVTGGGKYTEAGQQRIRVTGTGRILGNGTTRTVSFLLVLVDGAKSDSAWIEVIDSATGKVVPELSLPRVDGKPALQALRGGSVQQH